MDLHHQSARDYKAAREAGNGARCAEIVSEVTARYATRRTDGSELAEVYRVNVNVPLGGA